jgi:hypothetical protein
MQGFLSEKNQRKSQGQALGGDLPIRAQTNCGASGHEARNAGLRLLDAYSENFWPIATMVAPSPCPVAPFPCFAVDALAPRSRGYPLH